MMFLILIIIYRPTKEKNIPVYGNMNKAHTNHYETLDEVIAFFINNQAKLLYLHFVQVVALPALAIKLHTG